MNAPDFYHLRGKVLSELTESEFEQARRYIKLTL